MFISTNAKTPLISMFFIGRKTIEHNMLSFLNTHSCLKIFVTSVVYQCVSQDLETGCLKLSVVKYLGVQIFKGNHNILIFQP